MDEKPYIEEIEIVRHFRYNPNYGNDRICKCGHQYYRHFDTYDNMSNAGCKYCGCEEFVEFPGTWKEIEDFVAAHCPILYNDLLSRLPNSNGQSALHDFRIRLLEAHYAYNSGTANRLFWANPNCR